MVQWLGLQAFTAKGPGSIPGWGTKVTQAVRHGRKKKKEKKKKPNRMWGQLAIYTEKDKIGNLEPYLIPYTSTF